jgi:hypothetical protein
MRFRGCRERGIMRRHHERHARHVLPQKRGGEVDGVEGAKLGRHGLGGTVKHETVYLNQFERAGECEDCAAACREVGVAEPGPESKTIERTQAFGDDERACGAAANLWPP